ncbi:MAG: transcriptional regulator [Phycisphaerae bacterium]|jgi:putative transcriptional regulator
MATRRPEKRKSFGQEIIDGLKELRDALESGEPLEKRFTVHTVELNLEPGKYGAEEVRATRAALGASQAVFAKIMGTSTITVQSWEQGVRKPPPMACRLLDEINRDRDRWLKLLRDSVQVAAKLG